MVIWFISIAFWTHVALVTRESELDHTSPQLGADTVLQSLIRLAVAPKLSSPAAQNPKSLEGLETALIERQHGRRHDRSQRP